MMATGSLFDTPSDPALGSAADWVTGALLGSVAISLCVIAVAIVGLMLMTGRLAVRDGVRVVVGCFVLLGVPAIVAGLREFEDEAVPSTAAEPITIEATIAPAKLPPANYDPYAGFSLPPE